MTEYKGGTVAKVTGKNGTTLRCWYSEYDGVWTSETEGRIVGDITNVEVEDKPEPLSAEQVKTLAGILDIKESTLLSALDKTYNGACESVLSLNGFVHKCDFTAGHDEHNHGNAEVGAVWS